MIFVRLAGGGGRAGSGGPHGAPVVFNTDGGAGPGEQEKPPGSAEEGRETKADQQEPSEPEEKSTIDKVLDPAKKIKGLFKW